jgi:hypothetical protein
VRIIANGFQKDVGENEDACLLVSMGYVVGVGKWQIILVGKPEGKTAFGKPGKLILKLI